MNAVAQPMPRRPGSRAPIGAPPKSVYFVLGLFLVLEYTRAPSLLPILGIVRSQLILLTVLFFMWWKYGSRDDLKNPIVKFVFAFAGLCALSIFFTPNTRAAFNMMVNILTYAVTIILPLLSFVKSTDRLRWFLQLFVLSNAFIGVWSLTHSGQGPGGFISDENDCALVLNVGLPFALALMVWPGQTRFKRLLFAGCAFILVMGSIATLSRGGFLGLAACALTAFWYSRKKFKVIAILAVCAAIFVPLAPMLLPPKFMHEIESIDDPSDGTRQNRIYFWKLGWIMYQQNPIFGVGAGNYPWTVADYERKLPPDQLFRNRYSGGRPSHSLYFTLLPELGTAGVIVFGSLVYLVIQSGRSARYRPPKLSPRERAMRAPPPPPGKKKASGPAVPVERQALDVVGRALVASCIAFLATGAFISVLYYPSFWHLTGIAACLGSIVKATQLPAPAPVKGRVPVRAPAP